MVSAGPRLLISATPSSARMIRSLLLFCSSNGKMLPVYRTCPVKLRHHRSAERYTGYTYTAPQIQKPSRPKASNKSTRTQRKHTRGQEGAELWKNLKYHRNLTSLTFISLTKVAMMVVVSEVSGGHPTSRHRSTSSDPTSIQVFGFYERKMTDALGPLHQIPKLDY